MDFFYKQLKKVVVIENETLKIVYEKAKDDLEQGGKKVEEMWVFHGADRDARKKIRKEGFKIGGEGVAMKNGDDYGRGVYTSIYASRALPYAPDDSVVLLCSALVGQEGIDFNYGGSKDIFVIRKTEYLLPRFLIHFENRFH